MIEFIPLVELSELSEAAVFIELCESIVLLEFVRFFDLVDAN